MTQLSRHLHVVVKTPASRGASPSSWATCPTSWPRPSSLTTIPSTSSLVAEVWVLSSQQFWVSLVDTWRLRHHQWGRSVWAQRRGVPRLIPEDYDTISEADVYDPNREEYNASMDKADRMTPSRSRTTSITLLKRWPTSYNIMGWPRTHASPLSLWLEREPTVPIVLHQSYLQ